MILALGRQKQANLKISEFEASLVNILSSRTAIVRPSLREKKRL